MPYGMPKWMPQPATDQKMERCVANLTGQGKDKQSAIMICKAALIRSAKKGKGH